jgi:hypothetical protein
MQLSHQVLVRGSAVTVTTDWATSGHRPEPVAVTVTADGPLTREILKSVPFGGLFQRGRAELAPVPTLSERPTPSHRGLRLAIEELVAVAEVYRGAHAAGRPVVQAVAEACGLSRSAAAKRIRAARDAGVLEERA